MIFVDGVNIGEPDDVALRDRREISADGIFIVVATISSDDGSVVADPEVIFRGVAFLEEADALVEELQDVVEDSLEDAAKAGTRELHLIQEDLHDAVAELRLRQAAAPADGPARSSSRSEPPAQEKAGPPGAVGESPAGPVSRPLENLGRAAKGGLKRA